MSEAELRLLKEDSDSEFEIFFNRFKDDVELNPDLMRIVGFLGKVAEEGALERFFRPEGKMNDNVVALPVVQSKLRLYCLRLSDKVLILGNGGVKNTKSYQESKELSGFVLTLQKFDQLIQEGTKQGTVRIIESKIEIDNSFDL